MQQLYISLKDALLLYAQYLSVKSDEENLDARGKRGERVRAGRVCWRWMLCGLRVVERDVLRGRGGFRGAFRERF